MGRPFRRRPTHKERHSGATLMHAGFATSHSCVVDFHPSSSTVVSEEEYDGIVCDPEFIELSKNAAPLLKYAERIFSRPAYIEALTPSEKVMRR